MSPDGSRVAFKVRRDSGGDSSGGLAGGSGVHWDVAVLDLASGERTVIGLGRGIDDQLEWLDEDTLLNGLPREDAGWDAGTQSLHAPFTLHSYRVPMTSRARPMTQRM
ncbi:hypothetical protein [Citricoccus alkalitolerans]|uniref:Uncharacterized protein n=1 Tax=Citricoccus alkalitolerans TaxID=246603 RepID=A0ABV8Y1M6_9MICC